MGNDVGPGQRIAEIRRALGLSQRKFAEDLKISQAHVSAMELDVRKTSERFIKMVCFTFGVRETWFKYGQGAMFEGDRDYRLEELTANFKKLDELLQDYVLKQLRLTLEYQETARQGGLREE